MNLHSIIDFVVNALKTNQFAQGGFVVTILLGIMTQLKGVPLKIWNFIERRIFYTVNIEETDELFLNFELWLSDKYKKQYRNVEACLKFDKSNEYQNVNFLTGEEVKDDDKTIHYKQFNDTFYIWRGICPIRVYKGREKLENANNLRNAFYNKFELKGPFSKRILNNLLLEVNEYCLELKLKERTKNIIVKSSNQYGDWIRQSVIVPKDMDSIILDGKDELLEDIDRFLNNRKWYSDRNIPYKRGYLFSGNPGNGKTSFTLSLAKRINRMVNFLHLNRMDDESLKDAFKHLESNSLLVIEDIDSAFTKRDGKDDIKFTFSTLLNCLDGVFSKDDIIVIFTTNHPEMLDNALIRSGRIDYKIEFKNPSNKEVDLFIKKFFNDDELNIVPEKYTNSLSMSDIQDLCIRNYDNIEGLHEKLKHID